MTLRLLIDECPWPGRAQIARDAGHHGSTCVRDRGLSGLKDHQIIRFTVEGDYTRVTRNALDFRGPVDGMPGSLHAHEAIHAGWCRRGR